MGHNQEDFAAQAAEALQPQESAESTTSRLSQAAGAATAGEVAAARTAMSPNNESAIASVPNVIIDGHAEGHTEAAEKNAKFVEKNGMKEVPLNRLEQAMADNLGAAIKGGDAAGMRRQLGAIADMDPAQANRILEHVARQLEQAREGTSVNFHTSTDRNGNRNVSMDITHKEAGYWTQDKLTGKKYYVPGHVAGTSVSSDGRGDGGFYQSEQGKYKTLSADEGLSALGYGFGRKALSANEFRNMKNVIEGNEATSRPNAAGGAAAGALQELIRERTGN